MGTYSRWVLIRGWALIRINMVKVKPYFPLLLLITSCCLCCDCSAFSLSTFSWFIMVTFSPSCFFHPSTTLANVWCKSLKILFIFRINSYKIMLLYMYKQTVWKVGKNQYKIIIWARCLLANDCQRGLTLISHSANKWQ